MLPQHALDLGPVAVRRRDHPAHSHHRLADEGCDAVWPMLLDRRTKLRDERVCIRAQRRRRQMDEPRRERPEPLLERRDAGCRQRSRADAVVRGLARDDEVPIGLAARVPREPHELDRRLDALRTAVREEDSVEPVRRELGKARREPDRRLVREVPERRVELELLDLRGRDARELLAPVPDRALPQPACPVHVLPAVDVPERRTLAPRPDDRRRRRSHDRMRMQHVRLIELGQVHNVCLTVFSVVYSSIVCGPCS